MKLPVITEVLDLGDSYYRGNCLALCTASRDGGLPSHRCDHSGLGWSRSWWMGLLGWWPQIQAQSFIFICGLDVVCRVSKSEDRGISTRHRNGVQHVCHKLRVSYLCHQIPIGCSKHRLGALLPDNLRSQTPLILPLKYCPGELFLRREIIIHLCSVRGKGKIQMVAFIERWKGRGQKFSLLFETLMNLTDNVLVQNDKISVLVK